MLVSVRCGSMILYRCSQMRSVCAFIPEIVSKSLIEKVFKTYEFIYLSIETTCTHNMTIQERFERRWFSRKTNKNQCYALDTIGLLFQMLFIRV